MFTVSSVNLFHWSYFDSFIAMCIIYGDAILRAKLEAMYFEHSLSICLMGSYSTVYKISKSDEEGQDFRSTRRDIANICGVAETSLSDHAVTTSTSLLYLVG